MIVTKCKYFSDHKTASTLMIDDLVPICISHDGHLGPDNDWGFLLDQENSLYNYLDKTLFKYYPEIRGTIFLPIDSHSSTPSNSGYKVHNRGMDEAFVSFLHRLMSRFEFGFHGVRHSWMKSDSFSPIHEFASVTSSYMSEIETAISEFSRTTGICFDGGKFPGYKYNDIAVNLIRNLKSKWWALDSDMIYKRGEKNKARYSTGENTIYIPTNICGNIFFVNRTRGFTIKTLVKTYIKKSIVDPIDYILYLYENSLLISVQEHYQNQRPDGKRQRPNLYDDIDSLLTLYGFLRQLDIWHATCGEIGSYIESYMNTTLLNKSINDFSVVYAGTSCSPCISITADVPTLRNMESGVLFSGFRKNCKWVFDNITPGNYSKG